MARIVVLDDYLPLAEAVSRILGEHGHEAFGTDSEPRALEKLRSGWAELLIQDMMRKGMMGGVEFARLMRSLPEAAWTPILVQSADPPFPRGPHLACDYRGRAVPAQGWLLKPVDIDLLLGMVEVMLYLAPGRGIPTPALTHPGSDVRIHGSRRA